MKFMKMHGLGNDFLVIDGRVPESVDYSALAKRACERHTGGGADGILVVEDSDAADIRMRIINSDGSEAEMCGNGIRCFAKYVYEQGIVKGTELTVETLAGIMRPTLIVRNGVVEQVRVDMGQPFLECSQIPVVGEGRCIGRTLEVLGQTVEYTSVLVGVPHTIIFVDDPGAVDIDALGSAIEHAPVFPRRTNVNFAHVIDRNTVEMRTWERGCGRTLCCGTGASSTAVACVLNGKTGRSVDIRIALGTLHIDWAEDDHVYMTGPAAAVCVGELLD